MAGNIVRTLRRAVAIPCFRSLFNAGAPSDRSVRVFEAIKPTGAWRFEAAPKLFFSTGLNKQEEKQCWSCGAAAPSGVFMLCPACKIIQPASPSVNFFDIFGLKKEYELDTEILEKRYKDLQKKLHPDLYSLKSQKEQQHSADQSSQVINAYQVLLKPLTRATYLLESLGIDVEEEGTITDPEILMEVMEVQEAVSECSDFKKLQEMKDKAQLRMQDYERQFAEAMRKNDINVAKEAVQRMSYFNRIINNIIQKL